MFETKVLPENIEMETLTSCDLCGSNELSIWDKARSNTLSICRRCGLVFTNPRIAKSEVKDKVLYSEGYFRQASRMTDKLLKARRISYDMERSALEKYVHGGKILDVGCGMGIFLETFGESWEKFGCDVSSYALEEASNRGIKIYHGEFEKLDIDEGGFDVVYFRAALHHAYNPGDCIKKAYKILQPGGIIAICMSNNRDGIAGRLFKGHIKSYEQAHNYLFSTKTLERYLMDAGFTVLEKKYPYKGTNYSSFTDGIEIFTSYVKYISLKLIGSLNKPETYDFASPPFPGNYVNIYGSKQ